MEKVRRKMIRLLGVSIGVMMAGLMAVLFAIVYKMNGGGKETAAVGTEIAAGGALINRGNCSANGRLFERPESVGRPDIS